MNKIKLINSKKELIYKKIDFVIDDIFIKLNNNHKKILKKYLFKLTILTYIYFYNEQFIEQLCINKYQDIKSLLVLLLPFYELTTTNTIISLDEFFDHQNIKTIDELNKFNNNEKKNCNFFIDHQQLIKYIEYLDYYFINIIKGINVSYIAISNKLLSNWLNIFPYMMDDYKDTMIYKNFNDLYINKKFLLYDNIFWNDTDQNNFIIKQEFQDNFFMLGYDTLYGTIKSFLFDDIKQIKWMIYDINIDNKIIPSIILLGNLLDIKDVHNITSEKLYDIEKIKNIKKKWKLLANDNRYLPMLKGLILFYVKWLQNDNNIVIIKSKLSQSCFKLITSNINDIENDFDENNENNIYNKKLDTCIKKISKIININSIIKYILTCMHKFKYTWYGYICLDNTYNILAIDIYNEKYQKIIFDKINSIDYITPKTFYNYFKYLLHYTNNDNNFVPYSYSNKWDSIDIELQQEFIDKLNFKIDLFSITRNLSRIYPKISREQVNSFNENIKNFIKNTDIFVNIILQTLIYNGILTYFVFNPKITDNFYIPDKNLDYDKWKKYILDNLNIDKYKNSYHYIDNKKLIEHDNMINIMKDSLWYTNFGGNWLAQIQTFHHYVNQRVIYITGATGAGKSTVSPILLLYAVKIINYNNNARVFCTQPRIQPVESNSEQIAKNIGFDIKDDILNTKKDDKENNKKELNYIQFANGKSKLLDDNYHPVLRMYTDGFLYNILKNQYLYKHKLNDATFEEKNSETTIILLTNTDDINDDTYIHYKKLEKTFTEYKFIYKYINTNTFPIMNYIIGNIYDKLRTVNINKLPLLLELIKGNDDFDPIDNKNFNFSEKNLFDILLVDEAHEHNTYMDLILTISRFALYINNQVTFGIISATMDFDEPIYRKYYEIIDDNWKYPLDLTYLNKPENDYDRNYLDRRLHLSVPFGGTNFEIKEYNNFNSNIEDETQKIISILIDIFNKSTNGDILIFQPGQGEIKKLLTEINSNSNLPYNAIAVPFYSGLDENILEYIRKIDSKSRNKFRYNKDEDIEILLESNFRYQVPENYYKRFIIIATNIAEASITINTLRYVIDTGTHKVNIYNVDKNTEELQVQYISKSNQRQRRGRVGRVKPGIVYYTYDINKLADQTVCKICIENLTDKLISFITNRIDKYIDINNEPYKVTNIGNLQHCILTQYSYTNNKYNNTFRYNNTDIAYNKFLYNNIKKIITTNLYYPYEDGNYDLNVLEDNYGLFFIIHPDEINIKRDINLNVIDDYNNIVTVEEILNKNDNDDTKKYNKVSLIIEYNKKIGIIDSNNLLTKYGYLVSKVSEYLELNVQSVILLLSIMSYNYDINSYIYINILLFIIYNNENISFKLNNNFLIFADFLILSSIIPQQFYIKFNLKNNIDNIILDNIIENYDFKDLIKNFFNQKISNKLKEHINPIYYLKYQNNIENILLKYYNLKCKIQVLTNPNYIKKFIGENLKDDINFYNNKRVLTSEISFIKQHSISEQLCLLIVKNYKNNILIKVPGTNYYISYFNRDINKIHKISAFTITYSKIKKKIIYNTKIYNDYRNNIICSFKIDEKFNCSNIMWVPKNILKIISKNEIIKKNIILDQELLKKLYDDVEYNEYIKKIDIIYKYIKES